jgi:hypothetical protein
MIHVRSLALRKPNLKPVAGEQVVFTVADPKGNVLFKQKSVTSTYGLSSADCALDAEIPEGLYSVECKVGDTASKVSVDVKRYVLPKFRVEVQLDKPYYAPGEVLRGTIRLEYFFGKPLANAAIRIEARGVSGSLGPVELNSDRDGKAGFELRLPASAHATLDNPFGDRLMLDVTATDTAGQEVKRTVSTTVTPSP